MGSYVSQEEVEVVSADDSQGQATPQLSPISKLFTFLNDPRSPGNYSRTPILVQNQLDDPRSPGSDSVERTPLYPAADAIPVRFFNDADEGASTSSHSNHAPIARKDPAIDPRSPLDLCRTPIFVNNECIEQVDDEDRLGTGEATPFSSPFVRFKMDNEAYVHSPPIPTESADDGNEDDVTEDDDCRKGRKHVISNLAFQPSPLPPKQAGDEDDEELCTKIEDMGEEYDDEILGGVVEGDVFEPKPQEPKPKPKGKGKREGSVRKRLNATQKSLMKTVLFKPYNELPEAEEENEENQIEEGVTKRKPLGLKNTENSRILGNQLKDSNHGNQQNGAADTSQNDVMKNISLHKLTLDDKENRVLK